MKATKQTREIYQYHEVQTKKRKPWIITLFVVMILIVVSFSYLSVMLHGLKQSYQAMQSTSNENEASIVQQMQQQQPISLLVVGIEDGIGGKLTESSASLISLTALDAQSNGQQHILLAPDLKADSRTLGQILTMKDVGQLQTTAQQLLNLPIDYTIEVKLSKLRPLLDELGGVTLQPSKTMKLENRQLVAQQSVHLTAREVMLYMQKQESEDTALLQSQRQFDVIRALLSDTIQWQKVLQLKGKIALLQEALTTNLPFDALLQLGQKGYLTHYLAAPNVAVNQLDAPTLRDLRQQFKRN